MHCRTSTRIWASGHPGGSLTQTKQQTASCCVLPVRKDNFGQWPRLILLTVHRVQLCRIMSGWLSATESSVGVGRYTRTITQRSKSSVGSLWPKKIHHLEWLHQRVQRCCGIISRSRSQQISCLSWSSFFKGEILAKMLLVVAAKEARLFIKPKSPLTFSTTTMCVHCAFVA